MAYNTRLRILFLLVLIMKDLKKKLKNTHFYLIRLGKQKIKVFKYLVKNFKMMKIMNSMIG